MVASGIRSKEKKACNKYPQLFAFFCKGLSDRRLASACGSEKPHDERIPVLVAKDPTHELIDHCNTCISWHLGGGNRSAELWMAEGEEALCSRSIPGISGITVNWVYLKGLLAPLGPS